MLPLNTAIVSKIDQIGLKSPMDRLTAAKVFIDVAYSLSFTETAERLDMSRPMVTRYVEAMESWLQTRLLHRTTRKISLTTAGESCLAEIEAWVNQADLLNSIASTNNALSGTIRVSASMSFGFSQLMPAITAFMKIHPRIHIDVDLEDKASDLTRQQIDLAIRIAASPDPSLIGKPIALCESVIVATPTFLKSIGAYEEGQGCTLTLPSQLETLPCFGYKNFERHIWQLNKDGEHVSVPISCRLTVNEATALLHATLNHGGLTLQPTYLANAYIQSGELAEVLPEWKTNEMKIYALYSSRKHLSPAVRALIDFLEGYFKTPPW